MDPWHLKAELDRLAGAIERAGGRMTERDPNTPKTALSLFDERPGERHVNLPQEAAGSATWVAPLARPRERADADPRTQNRTNCAPLRQ